MQHHTLALCSWGRRCSFCAKCPQISNKGELEHKGVALAACWAPGALCWTGCGLGREKTFDAQELMFFFSTSWPRICSGLCVSLLVSPTQKCLQNAGKRLLWGNTADVGWPEAPERWALVLSSQTISNWDQTGGGSQSSLCTLTGGLCSSWELSLSGSVSHSQAGNCRYLWGLCGSPHLEVRNLPLQLLKYLTQMRSAGWFGLPK